MRPSLETDAPHPHLTHSTAHTMLTETISVTEIEHAQSMDGAKEPQDDLHPIKSILIFYIFSVFDKHNNY